MIKKTSAYLGMLFLLFLLIFWPSSPSELENQLSNIATRFLTRYKGDEHITALGITAASAKHPKPISIYVGQQNPQQPLTQQSLFQVGSIAKSYLAVILLQLEADPSMHFRISDDITKYFPEYPHWQGITVKELMNMTSGIPDYFRYGAIVNRYAQNPYHCFTEKNWLDAVYVKPLLYKPGTQFNYSNSNYLLLGLLIEKLTHHSLKYEIETRLLNPLKLQHTFYVNNIPPKKYARHLVTGYQNEFEVEKIIPRGTDVTGFSLSYLAGAGAMLSTSEDMVKWVQALFTPNKLLPYAQYQEMISMVSEENAKPIQISSQHPQGYGLGISAQYATDLKTPYYIYEGTTLGYRAMYVYIPSRSAVVAITVNSSSDAKTNSLFSLVNQINSVLL